jgi:hypothetical protein
MPDAPSARMMARLSFASKKTALLDERLQARLSRGRASPSTVPAGVRIVL